MKQEFVNVGTKGHEDHGKSSMSEAISDVLSQTYGIKLDITEEGMMGILNEGGSFAGEFNG